MKYLVWAGLGGGFGGPNFQGIFEFNNDTEAEEESRNMAIEEYQSYEGHHGINSFEDIIDNYEDFGITDVDNLDEVGEAYNEEVEFWIVYRYELYDGREIDEEGNYIE